MARKKSTHVKQQQINAALEKLSLGETLCRLMKAEGITQSALARRLGVNKVTVNRWCCNVSQPSDENLEAVAGALGVTAEFIRNQTGIVRANDNSTTAEMLRVFQRLGPEDKVRLIAIGAVMLSGEAAETVLEQAWSVMGVKGYRLENGKSIQRAARLERRREMRALRQQ